MEGQRGGRSTTNPSPNNIDEGLISTPVPQLGSPNNDVEAEPSTPARQTAAVPPPRVPPPCIHPRDLARMSRQHVDRIHRDYYRRHGVPSEEIPRDAYQFHRAGYHRAQFLQALQDRRAEANRSPNRVNASIQWSPITAERVVHSRERRISNNISERERERPSPRITISEVHMDDDGTAPCCVVCHEYFEISEEVRPLLQCKHFFHPHCIHRWFAHQRAASIKTNCPICRTNFP